MKNRNSYLVNAVPVSLVMLLAGACSPAGNDSGSAAREYLPRPGDEAIIFTHRFNPED
jgi:hypothetical protein